MYSLLSYNFIVIKAERIPYDSMSTMYTFPDEDDDLTNYSGGNAQVIVPNGLLQGNGKLTHTQYTFTSCKLSILEITYLVTSYYIMQIISLLSLFCAIHLNYMV